MPTVTIQRLDLSLRGVSPTTAQNALAALGPALTQALAVQSLTAVGSGTRTITRLTSAPIRIAANPTASALTTTIARQIASTVSSQLGSPVSH